jgi:hypothetical protein
METPVNMDRQRRRRQGQTLAEFALTLPILLLLMFGIIEFGRIFQAWVTLQNAARTAARYASTYQYDDNTFPLTLEIDQTNLNHPNDFVPCVDDGPESFRTYRGPANNESPSVDRRGTIATIYPNGASNPPVQIYTGGIESLFATWYDGRNCDPRSLDDQDRRRDMARLLSIMYEARRGAAGLAIESNQWGAPTAANARTDLVNNWPQWAWFQNWNVPPQRSDQRAWFHVMICSDRLRPADSNSYFQASTNGGSFVPIASRFVPYVGESTLAVNGTITNPWAPSCLLNETYNPVPAGMLNNAGRPWMDPGGPGDTVLVVVTFNHPLITPLGLAPYLTMQARRSAIVETFNNTRSRSAIGAIAPAGANAPTLTYTPTNTPPPSPTRTPIPSQTPTATVTNTPSPIPPFTCDLITLNTARLDANTYYINIRNDNNEPTYITRVSFNWPTIAQFPTMYLSQMALDRAVHWNGIDRQDLAAFNGMNNTDTNVEASTPPFNSTSTSIRTISAFDTGEWSATFLAGPSALANYVSATAYGGIIYLFNPRDLNGVPCQKVIPNLVPTATPTRNPSQPSPTPTFTPDCASSQITVRFVRFEQFGLVRLEVLNNRTVTGTLLNFSVSWIKRFSSMTLRRITAVAPQGAVGSVDVWVSSGVTQDSTPPTTRNEGTWVANYTFEPRTATGPSVTALYLDFDGTADRLDNLGVFPSDLNGTWFEITCDLPSGGSGGGGTGGGGTGGGGTGGTTGRINLANNPTPAPTPTQGPTNTPRPTDTPGPTNTPRPPTNTPTVGPTATPRPPTNTPPPKPTNTLAGPPTNPGSGCTENC